ncbi:hypothetical protein [Methylobacterium sp. Leaf88]|uniref:hypothetical protein n=1 Tax=Methylobacterium sp. Leaf88 TaxID=1736244 RepID=UPI000700E6CB|nr:hypothetical protein [Methylobacterium sp. Leaf88]KQO65615.1 hypothetical protein ASF20_06890 [Methylobacterium sp. Leaf88]
MNGVKMVLAGCLVSGWAWLVVPAQAQESLRTAIVAQHAAHSANVRAIQSRRDVHAANVAALHGDFGAARVFSHAAAVRQAQSDGDARFADRADRAARIQRFYGE